MARRPVKKLKVIPLGGLNEIGKNITVFEYENDIIIVDAGMAFPEDELLGIDAVIPDFSYLVANKEKIKGVIITHGHEDHIGAIAYLLQEVNIPVYGTMLSLGLIKRKLDEKGLLKTAALHKIDPGQSFNLGCFKIEFIRSTHSIADSVALALFTPVGTIVHTGDFKIDYTPISGEPIDLARFAELGKQGVLMLMADSTNVERPGYTMSESSIGDTLQQVFFGATGRIIVATFASNIHRVQQIIDAAIMADRKVALCGRSMEDVCKTAMELGYIKCPEGVLVEMDQIKNYDPEEIVIISTGSQGEPMSALSRIADGEHRQVAINPGDTVVLSSSPIPGNEKTVSNIINKLYERGAEVIFNSLMDVHVSGHACKEELKLIQYLVKPKYFMPVHGEYRHLLHHGALAVEMGLNIENVFICDIGDVLELTPNSVTRRGTVPSGRVLVDGLGVGDVGNLVLKDRKHLSEDGVFIVTLVKKKSAKEMIGEPTITSRGFVYVRDSEELMRAAQRTVEHTFKTFQTREKDEIMTLKNMIRDDVKMFIYKETKRSPMVIPVIMEV